MAGTVTSLHIVNLTWIIKCINSFISTGLVQTWCLFFFLSFLFLLTNQDLWLNAFRQDRVDWCRHPSLSYICTHTLTNTHTPCSFTCLPAPRLSRGGETSASLVRYYTRLTLVSTVRRENGRLLLTSGASKQTVCYPVTPVTVFYLRQVHEDLLNPTAGAGLSSSYTNE